MKNKNIKPSIAFELIKQIIDKFNLIKMVRHLCKVAGVSTSVYYRHQSTSNIRNLYENQDIESKEIILKAFNHPGYKKGSRTIKMTLKNEFGIVFSRKKIQRIMRKYNIICSIRKSNPYKRMTKVTKKHRVVSNKLNREFKQDIPGKVLLTDITYMPYGSNKVAYLSTIKDSSTNQILAYHLSNNFKISIVTKTIDKLIKSKQFNLDKNAFINSDPGSHYTSPIFQKLLKKYRL